MFLERILYFWDKVNAAVVSNMVIPTVNQSKPELKKSGNLTAELFMQGS